jgi:hypothetical protein
MTLEENTKVEESKDGTKETSDFVLWNVFFWKLIKRLLIIGAGTTAIVYICRWLIY